MPASSTGINHYWTYEEEPLPGIGKAMVNVGNGNLVVQVEDLDIPERGIDIAFQRTYNSQSRHDANNSDDSTPSVFGNGWTNTFDSHLAYNPTYNVISVYDIDGARYDFCANGEGEWNSCTSAGANNYTTLTSDGECGYYWTKKSGTSYYFEAPNQPSTCGTQIPAGLSGRILGIQGRNINNALTFTYSWVNGDDTNPENLTQIVVSHSDGQSVTLTFGLLNGTGPDELASISRSDGSTISYEYDSTGDLLEVDRPGNNTTTAQTCSNSNTECIPETYTYASGYLLWTANSPRYTVSQRANGTAQEGDVVYFAYDGVLRVTSFTDYGVVNFVPKDGVSSELGAQGLLHSGYPSGLQSWYTQAFSGYGTGTTTVSDSDGHSRMWTWDSLWRVTETQEYTGSQWLVSYQSWDTNDDLLTFTDERDNATTFEYDSNGNAIMEAQPSVTTSMGTFQPTAWYQYDQYNNLLYYCDPNWVHGRGGDYPNGNDPCTGSPNGVVHYVWTTGSSPDVYGELTDTYTPLGYHHQLTYDSDGLPLSVVGDTMGQADGSQRTPDQQFTYDQYGNLKTYNPGNGTWNLMYDSMNRVLTREDADGIYSYACYYDGGSIHYTETSYQHYLDANSSACQGSPPGIYATTYTYDPDGNVVAQTAVHGGTYEANAPVLPTSQGITLKFYDADDRLVEMEQPYDTTYDVYANPWITRYLYDLSQSGQIGSIAFDGEAISAHGNLYDTVELLPPGPGAQSTVSYASPAPTPVPNTAFQDLKGTAFDALDRAVVEYSFSYSASGNDELNVESLTYDASAGSLGLLSEDCNILSQCESFSYDPRGAATEIQFSDSTPSRTMTYDPDGHTISITSSEFGAQSYSYDSDGRVATSQDPTGGDTTSPATLSYRYYGDGKEEGIDVSSSALTQVGLFTYSYRGDGHVQTQAIDDSSISGIVNAGTTTMTYTYSAAGRMTERTETGPAANSTPVTRGYDEYGQLSAETIPGTTLTGFEYSPEGELLGATGATYAYDVRGELTYAYGHPVARFRYANGVQLAVPTSPWRGAWSWDDRMGVTLSTGTQDGTNYTNSAESFDTAGRQTGSGEGWCCNKVGGSYRYTETRGFDAEDHTISTVGAAGENIVAWGPNGHPITISSGSGYADTLHWSGNTLLFTTNAQGQLDDVKIGAEGDIVPLDSGYAGLTFYDRGPDGNVIACHNATGDSVAGLSNPYTGATPYGEVKVSPCAHGTTAMPTSINWWAAPVGESGVNNAYDTKPWIGHGGVLGMPRTDGYTDGTESIQGVRTFDSNAGTWTTPDAYAGNVNDPLSQKGYVWNGNNPEIYADPSGYVAFPVQTGPNTWVVEFPVVWDNSVSKSARNTIVQGIEKQWDGTFNGIHVTVEITAPKPGQATNYITDAVPAGYRSNVHGDTMYINMADADAGWVAGHEAGHLMSLPDEYKDVGNYSVPNPGYQHNVMGARDQTGVTNAQIVQILTELNYDAPPNGSETTAIDKQLGIASGVEQGSLDLSELMN